MTLTSGIAEHRNYKIQKSLYTPIHQTNHHFLYLQLSQVKATTRIWKDQSLNIEQIYWLPKVKNHKKIQK